MLQVRENEISMRSSSGGPEYLRLLEGTLLTSDDAMQMDVHKPLFFLHYKDRENFFYATWTARTQNFILSTLQKLYPFYTTKKMPRVTITITKKRFVGSSSQVY